MSRAALDRVRVFTVRDDIRHIGRTLMSIAVVAVSATLLVAVSGITGSISGSVQRLAEGLGGDAELEVSGISDGGFDGALRTPIAAVPGVAAAVPMVRAQIGSGSERTLLVGVDASVTALHSDMRRALGDRVGAALLAVPDGVVVGAALGHAEGATFAFGAGTVTAAAVLDTETSRRLNGGHVVIAPLPLAQRLAERTGRLDSVLIVLAPGADRDTVRADIEEAVGGRAVVAAPSLRTAQAGGAITLLRATTLLSASISLVVAGFLVYIAMSMAITQRRPTISLLRALGARPRVVVLDLLGEAAAIGVLGAAIGAVVGVFVGRAAIGQLPPAIVQSVDARMEFVLPGAVVPVAILACLAASLTAAAVAARQVYKVAPVEALVPVGVSRSDVAAPATRALATAVTVLACAGAVATAVIDLGRWSIVSIALLAVAFIGLCFVATTPIVRAAAAVARLFGGPGALGATDIERAPRRTWATLMTVSIAVVSIVSLTSTNDDVTAAAATAWSGLADADLYVSATAPDVVPTGPILPAHLESDLTRVPGVAEVVPGQITFAALGDQRVMIYGCAPGTPNTMYRSLRPQVRDRLLTGQGVVLSEDVARTLGVGAGDAVQFPTALGPRRVEVLEVVSYFSALSGAMLMNLDQSRAAFERPGSTNLAIRFAPGADRIAATAAVERIAPPGTHVFTGAQAVERAGDSVRQATVLSRSITWIVAIVAALALLNTLMMSVLERRRELGVLRAIGSSRRFAVGMIVAEAVGIGVVGGLLGAVIGTASQFLNARAMSHALTVDVLAHPNPMALVFAAAAVALCLLGAIPPALRAARLDILDAVAAD